MKIVLCGSLNFTEEIMKIKELLTAKGHEVSIPASIKDFSLKNSDDADTLKSDRKKYLDLKPTYTRKHFNKIASSDAILVVNLDKHGIKNYIGGATFAEIMIAFHHNKKIFLLNPIPNNERLSFIVDEIEAVKPIILNGNLDLIGE